MRTGNLTYQLQNTSSTDLAIPNLDGTYTALNKSLFKPPFDIPYLFFDPLSNLPFFNFSAPQRHFYKDRFYQTPLDCNLTSAFVNNSEICLPVECMTVLPIHQLQFECADLRLCNYNFSRSCIISVEKEVWCNATLWAGRQTFPLKICVVTHFNHSSFKANLDQKMDQQQKDLKEICDLQSIIQEGQCKKMQKSYKIQENFERIESDFRVFDKKEQQELDCQQKVIEAETCTDCSSIINRQNNKCVFGKFNLQHE